MKGARPKPPRESRADLEDEISCILMQRTNINAAKFLMSFFTTIDLIGIRDQLTPDKEPADGL